MSKLRIIRNSSGLPAWFNLTHYDAAASLDAAAWSEQLRLRRLLWDDVRNLQNEDPSMVWRNPDFNFEEIVKRRLDHHHGELIGKTDLTRPADNTNTRLGVRVMTDIDLDPAFDYGRPFGDHYWLPHLLRVCVNLRLPDDVLIDHFKMLLRSARKPSYPNGLAIQDFRTRNFSEWIRVGALPYIDLRTWACEARVHIPNRVMAHAIFPPGEGGEEVVRKTTRKLTGNLLSWRSINTLDAISAGGKVERNDK